MLDADMVFGEEDQRNVAVDSSEEGEVGGHRGDGLVVGVIYLYLEVVGPLADEAGDVEDEGGVAPLVIAGVAAVHIEVHFLVRPLETHEDLSAGEFVVDGDGLSVPGSAPPVPGLVVHRVRRIPGVGEGYRMRDRAALLAELPAIVYTPLIPRSSHRRPSQEGEEDKKYEGSSYMHIS